VNAEAAPKRLLVVSGMSGAGKTVALRALEDAGFYCVDNLPLDFLPRFAELMETSGLPDWSQVAVGIDARNPAAALHVFPEQLRQLRSSGLDVELLFFDATDDTLIRRFQETRRQHPLFADGRPLGAAIALERQLLEPLAEAADLQVDTTTTHIHQLRDLMRLRIAGRQSHQLSLQCQSFGFKYGVPGDADFVFDARFLPNPHWQPQLRDLTGSDPEVADFLANIPRAQEFLQSICSFLDHWVPHFEADDRSYLTVAIGCTGGRHRSRWLVEQVALHMQTRGRRTVVTHRER
jgi:RNase adapter protein RapZ